MKEITSSIGLQGKESYDPARTTDKTPYSSLIDNSFELVFRTSQQDQFIYSNRLFARVFGFDSYYKMKGSQVESVFEDPLCYHEMKQKVLTEHIITNQKFRLKKISGELLTCLVNCHFTHDERGMAYFNWTALDISDRIEFEEHLQNKKDQLEKVNLQMEKFLYSTSHDLRSPITSIFGLVNLLRMETRDKTVLDYAEKIEASTNKLDTTIRDIMTFSKATYQRLRSEAIDFEMLIRNIWNKYQVRPNPSNIRLDLDIKGEGNFFTDRERMEIIADKIIANSIHFSDPNKARPFLQIHVTIHMDSVEIEFADNGIGIGKKYLEHIFTMFYKASHTSKGAGLGLFLVKEALTQLHGSISVDSEIGFGSVFRILIPNDHKGKLINKKMLLKDGTKEKMTGT